jgi:hypothetical protein
MFSSGFLEGYVFMAHVVPLFSEPNSWVLIMPRAVDPGAADKFIMCFKLPE